MQVKQSKLSTYIRSNKDYYKAMQGHGYLLPAYSCAIVTRDYLDGIRLGEYYCPHKRDKIPKLDVPNPPLKTELLKLWKKALKEKVQEDP